MVKPNNSLPYRVLTCEQALDFEQRLSRIETALFQSSEVKPEEILQQELLPLEYRHINQNRSQNDEKCKELCHLISDMKQQLQSLPVIDIWLAFQPRQKFLLWLIDWLESFGPGASKVKITINNDIVAGIIIGYNGRIYDYSLSHKLEALL